MITFVLLIDEDVADFLEPELSEGALLSFSEEDLGDGTKQVTLRKPLLTQEQINGLVVTWPDRKTVDVRYAVLDYLDNDADFDDPRNIDFNKMLTINPHPVHTFDARGADIVRTIHYAQVDFDALTKQFSYSVPLVIEESSYIDDDKLLPHYRSKTVKWYDDQGNVIEDSVKTRGKNYDTYEKKLKAAVSRRRNVITNVEEQTLGILLAILNGQMSDADIVEEGRSFLADLNTSVSVYKESGSTAEIIAEIGSYNAAWLDTDLNALFGQTVTFRQFLISKFT